MLPSKYLPDDYASISLGVSFVHTAPTSIGMTVTVHAAIIAITDHDVTLDVKAWDEQGEIAHGTHRRAIVLKEDVLKNRLRSFIRIHLIYRSNPPLLPASEQARRSKRKERLITWIWVSF